MKKSLFILFLICFSCEVGLDTTTMEGFSESVINALINNDKEEFSKYAMTEDIAIKLIKSLYLPVEEELKSFRPPSKDQIDGWFDKLASRASKDGVDIQKISYHSIKKHDRRTISNGSEVADISVMVLYDEVGYYVKLDDCVRGASGKWFMLDDPQWHGTTPPMISNRK